MVLNFMTNDFIIIWNLLFGASISSESQDFKTTVWKKYRKQYESLQNDQRMMIRNIKNFIKNAIINNIRSSCHHPQRKDM